MLNHLNVSLLGIAMITKPISCFILALINYLLVEMWCSMNIQMQVTTLNKGIV